MRLYLSGPMTGHPDHNIPLFNQVTEELRQRHHIVLNPAEVSAEIPRDSKDFWDLCMRASLKAFLDYKVVVLLPNWQGSRGAKIEVNLADVLDMHVFELDLDTYEFIPTIYGCQDQTKLEH